MKEFHQLAAELGTYPPLTESERLEALKQVSKNAKKFERNKVTPYFLHFNVLVA